MSLDPQLIKQLTISAGMITATMLVHALFVVSAAMVFRGTAVRSRGIVRAFRDIVVLVILGVWLMSAHLVEIGLWAHLFLHLGLFESLEPALYFSASSYTTIGFGDVLIAPEWRLLSGACGAAGLLMFGLSAAFLFDSISKLDLNGRH